MEIRSIPVERTLELRRKVLRPHQRPEDLVFTHDHDEAAFHLGAFEAGTLVGVASFTPESHAEVAALRPYRLRGMAVRPDRQRQGIGSALMRHARVLLAQAGCDMLWCNARAVALPFYRREGLRILGAPFVIEGIGEHHLMVTTP
ncbi:MAG: GNAT family N-acetyltransferase [Flavobacteriales bacterium]|nr:GNAT family N-acetyltransferase [Flavobacteriales bacterium]